MSPDVWVIGAAVGLPFLAAAAMVPLHRLLGERIGYAGALVAAIAFGLVASQVGSDGAVALPWIPSLGVAIRFHVDAWALLFALLASGIGVLIFLYATAYMRDEPGIGRFYAALLAFMGSILGIAFAADLVLLFLFWELTSVASFVLIGYQTEDDEPRYAARMAMVVTVGGGLCLLVGLLLLAAVTPAALGELTFDLTAMIDQHAAVRGGLAESGLLLPVIALVGIAAAAKSAQVPLHFWLPRAMVAPTPVSAFLHSATMVKVGVYALGRFRPLLGGTEWTLAFATLGLATMTVGALLAVRSTDIKELLAYSTASHLGLMVAGFGFASHYGPEAGAFHLFNHALFKAALFLVAGIVAHEVGTRHLDRLGGLWRDLPLTAAIATVAGLSMAGIPPLSGFYSKELLFEAAWEMAQARGGLAWLYPSVATLASAMTVLYSLRFLGLFIGDRPEFGEVHRPPALLVVPPVVLASGVAIVSLWPGLAIDALVGDAASATAATPLDPHVGIPTELTPPVLMSALAITAGIAAVPFARQVRAGIGVATSTLVLQPSTWYRWVLTGLGAGSARFGRAVHNGLIRTYVTWTLGAACGLVLLGYAIAAVPVIPRVDAPLAMALVLAVAIVAAVAITTTPSHVTGVLTLGILGFMVAIFYILASAPDLALTQLVVETLLLLVFLLVIEELPAFYTDIERSVAVRDVALSLVVGATAFVSVLVAMPAADAPLSATARGYLDESVPAGGGANVVNVILTDFRAFDTLGEAVVVTVAAMSVLVLIAMRSRGETE